MGPRHSGRSRTLGKREKRSSPPSPGVYLGIYLPSLPSGGDTGPGSVRLGSSSALKNAKRVQGGDPGKGTWNRLLRGSKEDLKVKRWEDIWIPSGAQPRWPGF